MLNNTKQKASSKNGKKKRASRGAMKPFTAGEIGRLATELRKSGKLHATRDYALMCMAIDTMLRSVDLLGLTFGDVLFEGRIVDEFRVIQQKSIVHGKGGNDVKCVLSAETKDALWAYIGKLATYILEEKDRLVFPIKRRQYQRLVKEWCKMLGLDGRLYSTHSFRRTKPSVIYENTQNVKAISQLLGHTSIANTERYLGVTQEDALKLAKGTKLL
jgi:integrase